MRLQIELSHVRLLASVQINFAHSIIYATRIIKNSTVQGIYPDNSGTNSN